jgi:hypothetical protein
MVVLEEPAYANQAFHDDESPKARHRAQWLRVLRPFAFLRAKTLLPVRVRNLDRKPCRLFRTRWDGLKVSRFAPRAWRSGMDGWESGRGRLEVGISSAMGWDGRELIDGRVVSCERTDIDLAGGQTEYGGLRWKGCTSSVAAVVEIRLLEGVWPFEDV